MARKDNQTHSIRSGYRSISIGTWLDEILPLTQEGLDPIELQTRIIAVLTGMTEQEVMNLPISEYTELSAASKFLETPVDTGKAGRIASKYTIGDLVLIPCADYEKMTAAQFIDFQTFAKEPDKNVVQLLSVFLVPQGHKYNDGYDVREVQAAIRSSLSVQDAMEAMAFFLTKPLVSLRSSLISLERGIRKIKDKEKREDLEMKMKEAKEILSQFAGDGSQM